MATKTVKRQKRKTTAITLVGTYKEKQLAWIKHHGVYNYPVAEDVDGSNIRELWLYADAKARRHCFAATFVGVQTRAEFLAANPTYAKLSPGKGHAEKYLVFKTEYLDYGPRLDDSIVHVRTSDFTKSRAKKVAAAIKSYEADGEFGSLADYLPSDLAELPRTRLRVREAAVQLDFQNIVDVQQTVEIVSNGGRLAGERMLGLTCLDFFAGSGLVSTGLAADFQTIWANDISEKKALVFNANNEKGILQVCPIENIRGEHLPCVDLSWGSFPCQDLSLAGDMNGLYAERSGLFWQWLRVMDEMKSRPSVVVAENVLGLVSVKGGQYYAIVHAELLKRGYRVGAVVLDALNWLPQSRKRVFVIGVREDVDVADMVADAPLWCHPAPIVSVSKLVPQWTWWKMARPTSKRVALDDLIDFNAPCDATVARDAKLSLVSDVALKKARLMSRSRRRAFTGYKRTRNHKQVLEIRTDGIAGCLRTPCGGSSRQIVVIADKGKLDTRLLTVREAARLMGAPDSYQIPGSYNDGYMAMGDAVAVPVVTYLSRTLLAPLARRAR